MDIITSILHFINRVEYHLQVTSSGYLEHFTAGLFTGGLISYIIVKYTHNKALSILFGIGVSILFGFMKELKDFILVGYIDSMDIIYTVVGGVVGVRAIFYTKKFL